MGKLQDEVEVGNPQQPHVATVLLLDTSGSMDGVNIASVNQGLATFKEEVMADEVASKRVDLALVTFGEQVTVVQDFSSIETFDSPELKAYGATPMGAGILEAIELLERRKQQYKDAGIDYYRPWLFLITDGEPTDMQPGDSTWTSVVKRVQDGVSAGKFTFFAVGVEQAKMDLLQMIAPPKMPPVYMREKKWKELFNWLSKSQQKIGASKPGDQVKLDDVSGWGTVSA